MTDFLANAYPAFAERLRKVSLADLPTPTSSGRVKSNKGRLEITIKHDDLTGSFYGGNKLRKLEYLLQRVCEGHAQRVATFGSVASNHALATTLYGKRLGIDCTCLLSHQVKTPATRRVLGQLLQNSAEIVVYGGDYHARIETMRRHVQRRNCRVIPLGGSSWVGTVGYVNAGLELASQVSAGELPAPDRIYIATGTMGSAAGLALGLVLAGLDAEVHAIRVSPASIMNEERLQRLLEKTSLMLKRLDPAFPGDLASQVRIRVRHEFFGEGYAKSNDVTDRAIDIAHDQLGLTLEPTYTGKAMAALLEDANQRHREGTSFMFWNTYNSNPLPDVDESGLNWDGLPAEFRRYFD